MIFRPLLLALVAALLLSSCATKTKTHVVTDTIPAGSRIEYYAQIHNDVWQQTLFMSSIPESMPVRVAEKWALSAAQARLGNKWKDYSFRVTPPGGKPILVWQRRGFRMN